MEMGTWGLRIFSMNSGLQRVLMTSPRMRLPIVYCGQVPVVPSMFWAFMRLESTNIISHPMLR